MTAVSAPLAKRSPRKGNGSIPTYWRSAIRWMIERAFARAGMNRKSVTIPTLADAGINKNLADRARKMASIPEISAYVFCHHENNCDLQQTLHSRKPDVDSIEADNPFTVRFKPAKFLPDTHAVRQ